MNEIAYTSQPYRVIRVLRPGGKLISISGPPDPEFANEVGLNWLPKVGCTF